MTTIVNATASPQLGISAEQADLLNQQAWALRASDTAQALELAEVAQRAAEQLGYRPGLAQSMAILAYCHLRLNNYEHAREHALAALDLFEQVGDLAGQADALNTLGNIYSGLGEHHSALEIYLQSLALRRELGDQRAQAASLNNIGNVYYHLADYPNALESHRRSLAIKRGLGDEQGVAFSLNNIGNIYKDACDFEQARQRYHESLSAFQAIGDSYGEAGALSNLGEVYAALGDPAAALDYYTRSLAIEQAIGNQSGVAESLLLLGQLALAHPGLPAGGDALGYLQRALIYAHELKAQELIYKCHHALSEAFERQGDFAQALEHYRAFYAAERIIFNEALSEKTKKLQILYQVEASQHEAALQRAEAEVARIRNDELAAALANADHQRAIAEQASRTKSELLSISAHDLKNPLNAISGYADLVLMLLDSDSPAREFVEKMLLAAQHMLNIINQVLESNAAESGHVNLHRRHFDLSELAATTVAQNRSLAAQKNQILRFEAEPGCFVEADDLRLQQVLDNLLSNAIKFSPLGSTIDMRVAHRPAGITASVQDQGPGLTDADLGRAFGKFTRLSAAPTAGESSTGLGLFIVKQLVDLHGGQVLAENNQPGPGSTFMVVLPPGPGVAP